MLENRESYRRRRSGFLRTTSSVDAKHRVYLASRSRRGSGASGIMRGACESESGSQCGSDEESSVESLDLMDMSRSLESVEMAEMIGDEPAEGEIMEVEQSVDVDLPESAGVQDNQSDTDPVEVSLSDFANLLEESQSIPVETSSGDTDTHDVSPYESVELTQEPESTHAELDFSDYTIELEKSPQNPSEETSSRNFLHKKKKLDQEEWLEEDLPLNLKVPAHAREKSSRRSLECIEPILDRKAKLPLGPADAPLNKSNE